MQQGTGYRLEVKCDVNGCIITPVAQDRAANPGPQGDSEGPVCIHMRTKLNTHRRVAQAASCTIGMRACRSN